MKCPAFMRMVPRVQVSGLTMVEVLVVMAIVILLAALLLPVGKKMIELSKSTQCISNLKSIYMASMTHAQDHNMEIPCSYVNPNTGHCWYQALAGDPKTGQPTRTSGYLPLEYGSDQTCCPAPATPRNGHLQMARLEVEHSGGPITRSMTISIILRGPGCPNDCPQPRAASFSIWIHLMALMEPHLRSLREPPHGRNFMRSMGIAST